MVTALFTVWGGGGGGGGGGVGGEMKGGIRDGVTVNTKIGHFQVPKTLS